ncbi:hypothetical protein DV702_08900 [Sporosarcina sp. PTS2304]|uniref:hypothetical protein n=1 Tax=Sporosarcina sp. PTS2304 TaxID=2283194 RepID=UPI000E0CF1E0|nr:hypothetical protein [Sporosarcina sp. PTS2304]AXH99842.1 hypothetical protein DV702_08900 [Sporosarcina sp. PTS2304]
MVLYAYIDRERTKKFYAKEALKEDKKKRYYCPSPTCDAHMYLCSVDGVSSAYFSATRKQHSHRQGCGFEASNNFKPQNFDEASFDFENVLEAMRKLNKSTVKNKKSILHKNGEAHSKPLRTTRQIYEMCKSYPCSHKYNNLSIGKMLLDDRSEYMYPKGVFGNRIIESKVKRGIFYDSTKMELRLVAPSSKKYELILQFADKSLFLDIKNSLYKNRDKLIILSGLWESSATFNSFCTKIVNKSQIVVLNKLK